MDVALDLYELSLFHLLDATLCAHFTPCRQLAPLPRASCVERPGCSIRRAPSSNEIISRRSGKLWVSLETSGCEWEWVLDTVTCSEAVCFSHAPEGILPSARWKRLDGAFVSSCCVPTAFGTDEIETCLIDTYCRREFSLTARQISRLVL